MKALLLSTCIGFQAYSQTDSHAAPNELKDSIDVIVLEFFPSDFTTGGWCLTEYSVLIGITEYGDTLGFKMAINEDLLYLEKAKVRVNRNVTNHLLPNEFIESKFGEITIYNPSKTYVVL